MLIMLLVIGLLPGRDATTVQFEGCMAHESKADTLEELEAEQNPDKDALEEMAKSRGSFSFLAGEHKAMTVQVCVQRCWMGRFDFAALQSGDRCYCGTSLKRLKAMERHFCYLRCAGNCLQFCGGRVAMSVYQTGYEKLPFKYDQWDFQKGNEGCFYVDESECYFKIVSPLMNPAICILNCNARYTPYAAFKHEDECCCKYYQFQKKVGLEYCDKPCIGDRLGDPDTRTDALCVGFHQKNPTSLTYKTRALSLYTSFQIPRVDLESGYLFPAWPRSNLFEEHLYRPQFIPPKIVEVVTMEIETTTLNTTNDTSVTQAEDSGSVLVWVILGIVLSFLAAVFIAIGNFFHRRNLSPEIFELPDDIEMKLQDDSGDNHTRRKKKKKREEKRSQQIKSHPKEQKRAGKPTAAKRGNGKGISAMAEQTQGKVGGKGKSAMSKQTQGQIRGKGKSAMVKQTQGKIGAKDKKTQAQAQGMPKNGHSRGKGKEGKAKRTEKKSQVKNGKSREESKVKNPRKEKSKDRNKQDISNGKAAKDRRTEKSGDKKRPDNQSENKGTNKSGHNVLILMGDDYCTESDCSQPSWLCYAGEYEKDGYLRMV